MEQSYEIWFDPATGQHLLMLSDQVAEFLLSAPVGIKQKHAFKAESDGAAQEISEELVGREAQC